jgi:hypothetical protein
MIVAYSRGDGAATNYEIARVTVALQHLRAGDDSWARIDPVRRWLQTLWFGGRSSGHVAAPASLLALADCRQPQVTARHATLCLSSEGRPEDRAAEPGGTRPVPGESCLTGVWPGLGLARVPGRVSSLAG